MVVGEAPGRMEIERGVPFCGRSGHLLAATFASHRFDLADCYVTNVFKGDVGAGNPTPTKEQIEDHSSLLWQELQDVSPRAVLLLGRVAVEAFADIEGRLGGLIGATIHLPGVRPVFFPCWHPAYVLRQSGIVAVEFDETIGRFIEHIRD
jgi:DNA polymerase